MDSHFAREWAFRESHGPRPTRVRKIVRTSYEQFEALVNQGLEWFARYIVESLYAGDVYVLRRAFDPAWMEDLRERAFLYGQATPSSFHKMLEGTPDFHRIIDLEAGKKYAFHVCKHSSFFYRWNDDPLGLFPVVYERWRVIKVLMGLRADDYERNTPRDGVIDRVQLAQYPSRIGFLEPHSDPYLHQRLFFSGYMSTRGVDYQGGGFYLVGHGDRVVDAEDEIEAGDVGIGYATIYHGVAPCNRDREPNWNSPEGRWFLSMYSNASDEVPDRHTGHPVKLELPGVMP